MTRHPIRPRRSVLYMPGSNARAQEKAKMLPVDGLILDLEDATAPDAKEAARELVCKNAREGGYGSREVIIRVNGADTPWGAADLAAASAARPHAVLLPKVERPETVALAARALDEAGAHDTVLWCMMETPLGVLRVESIASASPRVACLVMGTSDLSKDLHALHTRERLPMLTSLGLCLLAARAHHLSILDGVHLDLDDEAGFRAACQQGLELGFDGKTLIHPKQVAACNEVFSPAPAAIEHARRVMAAFQAAREGGAGVAVLDGKLVESLHAAEAERLVALADALAAAG
ncbi:MAG: CoA ester lyase [Sorangiineae bacterium]|nr:CoA ester lyase [Polyangiaceae bacterium]MEB2323992.1 CoA ester lyase [Sorangiineae bacterium]